MKFFEKFGAGFEMAIKASTSHRSEKRAGKDVYDAAKKWEKKAAREEKTAARKAK